jgi:hypothetical protein
MAISVLRPPDRPPSITIVYPAENARLKGTIQARGTASTGSLPLNAIKIRIDNGTWKTAVGLDHWSFTIDTVKLANGDHRIEAKSFDANLSSETATVDFTVSNSEPGVSLGSSPWLPVVIIAVAAGLGAFIFLRKRKG